MEHFHLYSTAHWFGCYRLRPGCFARDARSASAIAASSVSLEPHGGVVIIIGIAGMSRSYFAQSLARSGRCRC